MIDKIGKLGKNNAEFIFEVQEIQKVKQITLGITLQAFQTLLIKGEVKLNKQTISLLPQIIEQIR